MQTSIGPTADDWTRYGKVKPRRVAKPRRAANDNARLGPDRVPGVLEYRNQPDHPFEPLSSNWSVTPSGIVEFYDEDQGDDATQEKLYNTELEIEVRPSTREILRAMAGDWTWYKPSPEDYEGESVASIGNLHFSNGRQRERMVKTKDGRVATYLCAMPRGALLGAIEKTGGPKGASQTPERAVISNAHLTLTLMRRDANGDLLNPPPTAHHFIPMGDMRKGPDYTPAETQALLDKAIANTPVMPPVTYCPPGIASGTEQYSDQFISMKPKPSGKGGMIGWVDFYTAGRDRAEWLAVLGDLDEETKVVLEAALSAEAYQEVGMAAGQSEEYARRKGGKLKLVAANDNIEASIRKFAA